jgi:hypothetical protein
MDLKRAFLVMLMVLAGTILPVSPAVEGCRQRRRRRTSAAAYEHSRTLPSSATVCRVVKVLGPELLA